MTTAEDVLYGHVDQRYQRHPLFMERSYPLDQWIVAADSQEMYFHLEAAMDKLPGGDPQVDGFKIADWRLKEEPGMGVHCHLNLRLADAAADQELFSYAEAACQEWFDDIVDRFTPHYLQQRRQIISR